MLKLSFLTLSAFHTNRLRWTVNEKRIVLDAFGYYLEKNDAKLPTFIQIGNLIKKHSHILKNRNVATIQTWLHNQKRNNCHLKYKKIVI